MLSSKLTRTLILGLALAAPAALAGDAAAKLNCPTGTKQFGSVSEGLTCRKTSEGGSFVAHGPYAEYHPNGKLAAKGQYTDGFKTGVWTFYDETGRERGTTEFKEGNYHGQRVLYFPSGKPRIIEEYQNGRKNGLVKELAEDGRVVSQVRYENNRAVANQ